MLAIPPQFFYCSGLFNYPVIFLMSWYEAEEYSFKIFEELCWNFNGGCIKSVDCFCRMTILAILSLQNLWSWKIFASSDIFLTYFFNVLRFVSFSFSSFYHVIKKPLAWLDLSIYYTKLCHITCLVRYLYILSHIVSLEAVVKCIVSLIFFSVHLSVVYRRASSFWALISYPST